MDDEDEWEYEYDEEETEDIYITIDFSTYTPPAAPSRPAGTRGGNRNGPHKQARNARRHPEEDTPVDTTSPSADPPDHLQILDLHTANPLISYASQIYTCHWATDIGTTLFISAPNSSSSALRSFPSVDILAKTRTRLVAVPARLKPSVATEPEPISIPPPDPNQSWSIATVEGDTITYDAQGRLHIAVPAGATPAKISQARFLAQWAALKAARGKTDPVPIKTIRGYKLPEGWREERRAQLEEDREEALASGGRRRRKALVDLAEDERRVRFRSEEDGEEDVQTES